MHYRPTSEIPRAGMGRQRGLGGETLISGEQGMPRGRFFGRGADFSAAGWMGKWAGD